MRSFVLIWCIAMALPNAGLADEAKSTSGAQQTNLQVGVGLSKTKVYDINKTGGTKTTIRLGRRFDNGINLGIRAVYWETQLTPSYHFQGTGLAADVQYFIKTNWFIKHSLLPFLEGGYSINKVQLDLKELEVLTTEPISGYYFSMGCLFNLYAHLQPFIAVSYEKVENLELKYHKYVPNKYIEQQDVLIGIQF